MIRWLDDHLEPVIIGGLVSLLGLLIWWSLRDAEKFARYAEEHHCVVEGQDPGYYMTVMVPMSCGNNCTSYFPVLTWYEGAKHYACDGGERFKR